MFSILKKVGLGGTFDHFHEGHELLIKTALSVSEKIVIGLTDDEMLKNKKFKSKIEPYDKRKAVLERYISKFTDLSRVEIVKLTDPYGPPINEPDYDGIVVSEETYKGALKINEIRIKKGMQPLIITVIPMVKDKDNRKISSTSIREKLV